MHFTVHGVKHGPDSQRSANETTQGRNAEEWEVTRRNKKETGKKCRSDRKGGKRETGKKEANREEKVA